MSSRPVESRGLIGIVLLNAALWTAGNGLTTGGFLNYFALELGASASWLGLIAATPETFGISGLATRSLFRWGLRRKAVFFGMSLAARAACLVIPLLAFQDSRSASSTGVWWLWGSLVAAAVFQGIASVTYHTWLADAVPKAEWGRLFAWRNMAVISVQMTVPLGGALLRDSWRDHLPKEWALVTYSVVFAVGIALQVAALMPLWRWPDVPPQLNVQRPDWSVTWAVFRDPDTRWLLWHAWCLGAANGLTQAVFFKYQKDVLHLSLSRYYLLTDLMWGVQIVTSWLAGRWSAKAGHRTSLLWGTFVASCALPFWCLATEPTWWWLFGAFFCWGAFGAVNVAGPNLMLDYAPRGDSAIQLALFRHGAGLLAGLTGILGGVWLDSLLQAKFEWRWNEVVVLSGFHAIFVVSWIGRLLAVACVLPVRENSHRERQSNL